MPLAGALVLLVADKIVFLGDAKRNAKYALFVKNFSLFWTLLIFNISIVIAFQFDPFSYGFQFIDDITWFGLLNNNIVIGVDGLSIVLILLTTFLFPICVLLSWSIASFNLVWTYCVLFLFLESILISIFCCLDLLVFYILFEAVLIPMYFIVGLYGSRSRKIRASYLLFLYTLVSSIIMFICILFIYLKTGTTNYFVLRTFEFESYVEKLCWLGFFLSFAVKMPIMPFHIWLPEAHTEASTAGSVILAGVLLKLGGYGFLRYSIVLFPIATAFYTPFIYILSACGVVYASLTTLQQVDLKKIIAYSSVGHMAIVTIGIFSNTYQGILGSIVLMIGHGITSSGLFITIGMLYERYNTRIIKYYSGLMHTMPIFSSAFILLTLGNLGLPLTSNFIGEVLVIVGIFIKNTWIALLASSSLVLSAGYSLWLCNRLLFGNFKHFSIIYFSDLTRRETYLLLPFMFLTILIGIYPECIVFFY